MRMRVMEHDSCALTFGPSSTASTADAVKKTDGVNDRPRGWCPAVSCRGFPLTCVDGGLRCGDVDLIGCT